MKMTIRAESNEVTALVVVIQERPAAGGTSMDSEREHLIREYERQLESLKSSESAVSASDKM